MSKFNVKKVIATLTLVGGLMVPVQHVWARATNISVDDHFGCAPIQMESKSDDSGNELDRLWVVDLDLRMVAKHFYDSCCPDSGLMSNHRYEPGIYPNSIKAVATISCAILDIDNPLNPYKDAPWDEYWTR